MSPEESSTWLDRRRRMVRCKVHGLHYDPKLTSGCALCRKEGLLPTEKPRPQVVVFLLSILGLAVVAWRLAGPFASTLTAIQLGEEPPAPVRRAAPPAEIVLDPEPYRTAVERVESAVFTPQPASLPEMADVVTIALQSLETEISGREPEEGAGVVADLARLRTDIDPADFDLSTLDRVRSSWRALRRRHFEVAEWFLRSSPHSEEYDPAAVAVLGNVAQELAGLIDEGATQAGALRGRVYLPNETASRERDWTAFHSAWLERVAALEGQLPPRPPASAPSGLQLGVQSLEQAFALARGLATSPIPDDARFAAATDAVTNARQTLERELRAG